MTDVLSVEGLRRLDGALAWIGDHQEQHDQDVWASTTPCGTTYCVAGTLANLAGGELVWEDYSWRRPGHLTASLVKLPDGSMELISNYAARLLGIDPEGGIVDRLFYAAETYDDLKRLRDELALDVERRLTDGG